MKTSPEDHVKLYSIQFDKEPWRCQRIV